MKEEIIYDQISKGLAIKTFLDELFGEYSGSDKPYSSERVAVFWTVVQQVLEPEEEQLIFAVLHGILRKEDFDEKEKFLYELASAKLRGDILAVNALGTSERGYSLLDEPADLTCVQEDLKYKNAKATLERIQRLEKGPWIVGQIWL